MKTLNWKIAMLTFTALAVLDAVLLAFSLSPTFHGALVSIGWWIFNAPGMLLAMGFQRYMGTALPDSSFIYLLIGAGVISALVWSLVGGIVFHRKYVA